MRATGITSLTQANGAVYRARAGSTACAPPILACPQRPVRENGKRGGGSMGGRFDLRQRKGCRPTDRAALSPLRKITSTKHKARNHTVAPTDARGGHTRDMRPVATTKARSGRSSSDSTGDSAEVSVSTNSSDGRVAKWNAVWTWWQKKKARCDQLC